MSTDAPVPPCAIGVAPDLLRLVPGLAEATRAWGNVFEGFDREGLDAVILRSTTRVDQAFLDAHSSIRWVASATSGTDHLASTVLAQRGVAWTAAPGCNAEAVADWVELALASARSELPIGARTLGIIGVGNVGQAVEQRMSRLGWDCVGYDPPRQRREPSFSSASWDDVLAADAVTLHVPLDESTEEIVDAEALELGTFKVLLNAARGGVMHEEAAKAWANNGGRLYLDVYRGEPSPDPALIAASTYATPHIAGHTLHAKLQGIARCVRWLAQGRPVGDLMEGLEAREERLAPAEIALNEAHDALRRGAPFKAARASALRRRLRTDQSPS